MSNAAAFSPRDTAVARYGDRFGVCPPLFYMASLDDARFIALIDQAISAGNPIDTNQFEADLEADTVL